MYYIFFISNLSTIKVAMTICVGIQQRCAATRHLHKYVSRSRKAMLLFVLMGLPYQQALPPGTTLHPDHSSLTLIFTEGPSHGNAKATSVRGSV